MRFALIIVNGAPEYRIQLVLRSQLIKSYYGVFPHPLHVQPLEFLDPFPKRTFFKGIGVTPSP
mgnify:CR=1 FL=1